MKDLFISKKDVCGYVVSTEKVQLGEEAGKFSQGNDHGEDGTKRCQNGSDFVGTFHAKGRNAWQFSCSSQANKREATMFQDWAAVSDHMTDIYSKFALTKRGRVKRSLDKKSIREATLRAID